MKYIFISGGVVSGLGKGITSASISMLLQSQGYTISPIKVDMYMNIDSGTLRPSEHGEVFVTKDGMETDQDIGNYERFLNKSLNRKNYITLGQIFQEVIRKERSLEYGGETVDFIPHVTDEIIRRIREAGEQDNADFVVVELGGTVGEYKNAIFYESARMMKMQNPGDVAFVHVVYIPFLAHIGELKTKPAQASVHVLNGLGIQPDFLVARAEKALDEPRLKRLSLFCNVTPENVFANPDVESIYEIPMLFEKQEMSKKLLAHFGMDPRKSEIEKWESFYHNLIHYNNSIKIGLVGKYFASGEFVLSDAYISVIEAVKHASSYSRIKVEQIWINSEEIEAKGTDILKGLDGIVIPQGWGSRGVEGKIKAIQYARENKIPYLGLCFGMQMAVIEYGRNVLGWEDSNTEEANPNTPHPVIHVMPHQKEYLANKQYGGTIRLGAWPCLVEEGTHLHAAYELMGEHFHDTDDLRDWWKENGADVPSNADIVFERHRHRYEFNNSYREEFEKNGFVLSGTSPDGLLVEAIELKDHPFYVGTQFHPELKSRPLRPHPLFVAFIDASLKNRK
ncbi:MAG: CTP synthase [bacterium]|nr:CTP synthase [bacterium]